tara:strand:- start:386 stop:1579 length:1194 start_codon:yes stop_codon:yes gene_type:complete
MNKIFEKGKGNQSIIIIANSSKYLVHYRSLLIKKLNQVYENLYVIAPIDKSTKELKKLAKYIPLNYYRQNEFNFYIFITLFFILFKSIRSIRPKLVHSHTLKTNLLVSIVNFFLGVNTIISFPGMGRLSNSKGLKHIFLKFILRIIYFTSIYNLYNIFFIKKNLNRVKFIFQNPIDLNFFIETINVKYNEKMFYLIAGSGLPSNYLKSVKNYFYEVKNNFDFIYCARLEKSKGINLFISLAKYYPNSNFFVYGSMDKSSKDYLSKEEIIYFKNKNKNLRFMDYIEYPLLNHHNDNSIFIVPSNYGEGLPRGILEAMSLEIPVIASQKACVGLFDNKTLFMVLNNKIESYINVIEEISIQKKEGVLNNFLNNSKKYIIKNYIEKYIVERTMNLYRDFE